MRLIGYLGIAILLLVAAFGILTSIAGRDWYGVAIMAGFVGILAFLAAGLRAAARRETDPMLKANSGLGWYGESLSALFRGPILHTPEGAIMLMGGVACILFAALSFYVPAKVGLPPARSAINATAFGLWPILLFVLYIKFCAPTFRPAVFTSLVMLCIAGIPFYMAYK
jgi:hypothetical protein